MTTRVGGLARQLDSLGPWLALGVLCVVLGLGVRAATTLEENTAWVEHTLQTIGALEELGLGVSGATNARRGYTLTGDTEQRESYERAVAALTDAGRRLRALTVDNPRQQRRLDELEGLLRRDVARQRVALDYRRAHGLQIDREAEETQRGTRAYQEIRERLNDIAAEERALLVERELRRAASITRQNVVEVVGAGASLALILTVLIRMRREIRRRQHSEQAFKRLNEALDRRVEERTAELRAANDELESFSYAVVHDLRAPLRGMAGFAELLLEEQASLGPDARDCLVEIQQNAFRMALSIDALVAMSRITRSELLRSSVDFTALARAVAKQSFETAGRRAPVLAVQEDLRMDADSPLARTLVEILLSNSFKFTSKQATARIEVGGSDVDGERVVFVRDNGAGFDMDHADKLFAPFGRLHTAREFPGIGIGLATAQRIVRRHGGRIWAEGHVGKGAAFYFTLGPKADLEAT